MPASDSESVVESCSQPDYSAVEIPSKARTEYSYVERRAELLQLIDKTGAPAALNQSRMADRYGVTQQQISKDFARLAKHIRDRLPDRDRRAMIVGSAVRRSINGLLDEGEYRKAAKTAMEYDDWIYDFHDAEEFERRLDELESEPER